MSASKQPDPSGDFTLFGFVRNSEPLLRELCPARLGITPVAIPFGSSGTLFFYTSYGEVAESEEALVLKLGFLRALGGEPLSAQQLLEQELVKPDGIEQHAFRGNALIAAFSKKAPLFSGLKTLIAVPQLYYAVSEKGILCSDRLRCLVALLDTVAFNEDVLPMHFLFRSTPGTFTYFRGVERLLPGTFFQWRDGALRLRQVQDLRFSDDGFAFSNHGLQAREALYRALHAVVGDYTAQIEDDGKQVANLLSGGVDSSLVQSLINETSPCAPRCSFSFSPQAQSFAFEVGYAKQASQFFDTLHTFVEFSPEAYAQLLTEAIEILGQPPVLATEPSILSIARFVDEKDSPIRFFFSGQAADTLFGLTVGWKLKALHYLSKIPAASGALGLAGALLKPFAEPSRLLLKSAEILACGDNPDAFVAPENAIVVYADWELMARCFGERALRDALAYRRELASSFLETEHYLEKAFVIELLTDAYEIALQRQQLFLAYHREQLYPFLDEDILRISFAFHPDVRYLRGFRPKYLLKKLLYDKTNYPEVWRTKGYSVFEEDWYAWMQSGPLRPLIDAIDLPAFLSRADFDKLIAHPNYFLWELLILDLFKKQFF